MRRTRKSRNTLRKQTIPYLGIGIAGIGVSAASATSIIFNPVLGFGGFLLGMNAMILALEKYGKNKNYNALYTSFHKSLKDKYPDVKDSTLQEAAAKKAVLTVKLEKLYSDRSYLLAKKQLMLDRDKYIAKHKSVEY